MNLLETAEQSTQDSVKTVLAHMQQLLQSTELEPFEHDLEGLASAFAVDAAGMTAFLEEVCPSPAPSRLRMLLSKASWQAPRADMMPWEKDERLLDRIKQGTGAIDVVTSDGISWLLAPFRQGSFCWLPWLASREPRTWTAHDQSCLALAGQCLRQRLTAEGEGGRRWPSRGRRLRLQEGIDKSAAVTRRLTHDFCNILTSILGFAELAALNLTAESPAHRYITEVLESARQGARWSQRLQMFSQNLQQQFLPTSLSTVVNEEALRPLWHRDIALKIDLQPDLPPVAVEMDSLRHVLTALLDNAREAIAGQGIVIVAARSAILSADACLELMGKPRPGPHVELSITDSGAGLSPDIQDRLFRDMFFTTKGRRRGLGLASVYGILQSYDGGFSIQPAEDCQGTIVQVYLPLARSKQK